MTLKSLIVRITCLLLLLSAFWALGGFDRPVPHSDDYRSVSRVAKAWFLTVALFVLGAGIATVGEIFASIFDHDYPPAFLVILGLVLMFAGALWMRAIRGTIDSPNQPAAGNAGTPVGLATLHPWPGVPEPGRSATGSR